MNKLAPSRLAIFVQVAIAFLSASCQSPNSYLNDTGSPAYSVQIPVENGFIDVSNGNLHLEFPLASHPQRGALKLNERITYDSRIWEFSSFGTSGSYHWWPYNVPGASYTSGGWQFVTGAEVGSITYSLVGTSSNPCGAGDGGDDGDDGGAQQPTGPGSGGGGGAPGPTDDQTSNAINWTDPSGTVHPFNAFIYKEVDGCDHTQDNERLVGGFANDASGYQVLSDAAGNIRIIDSSGTQVYPTVIDRYGNYWSWDSSHNLVDDTGRTPVLVSQNPQNANVMYYDVLAPNGPINNNGTRVRYTVTIAPVNVSTNFQPYSTSDIYPWISSNLLTPVQSIQLPDGTQYSFTYDINGEVSSVTLPTGGVVKYAYVDFVDSANTENNWLTLRTVGSNPSSAFKPTVGTKCANYSTGCIEYVNYQKPSGDATLYELTLANGAWNTATSVYSGPIPNAVPFHPRQPPTTTNILASSWSTYQYSNACSGVNCAGANYVTSSIDSTLLFNPGNPGIVMRTQSASQFDPVSGKPTSVQEWDYIPTLETSSDTLYNTVTSPPIRETDYTYTGLDLSQVTVRDVSTSAIASQTTYGYTSQPSTFVYVSGNGATNAGGPYLQSVSRALNTGQASSTTTYAMDNTGMIIGVTDADGNPTTVSYQCSNSLVLQGVNALQQASTSSYDCSSGALMSSQDANDLAAKRPGTIYSYEAVAGRPFQITHPDGGSTMLAYPSATESTVLLRVPLA